MDDQDRAVELFNEALDLNPSYLEAFERINKILTAQKDWKQLERAFRKMLHRVARRTGQHRTSSSTSGTTSASSTATACSDTNSAHRGVQDGVALQARRAGRAPDPRRALRVDRADRSGRSASTQSILQQRPAARRSVPQRSTSSTCRSTTYDRAWCMCAALAFLRKADEEEQRFFEDYRPQGMIQVKSRLDNEQWVQEPLPQGREPLHRQDLRDARAGGARREDRAAARRRSSCRCSTARFKQDPATSTVTFAQDVRLGGAGARHPAARSSTCATTCPARSWRCRRRRRRRSRVRRCSPASRRRS